MTYMDTRQQGATGATGVRWRVALVALAASLFGSGCASDQWVEFRLLTAPPDNRVLVERDRIEIPAGIAVGVEATPFEDDEEAPVVLELLSKNPGVVGCDQGLKERTFVIYGVAPGATEIEVRFGRDDVGTIPATVVE